MKIKVFYLLFIVALVLIGSCNRKKDNTTQAQTQEAPPASSTQQAVIKPAWNNTPAQFAYPELPVTIVDPAAQADYMVEHFWDSLNFNDTLSIHQPGIGQQVFQNYVTAMYYADKEAVERSIEKTLSKAETEKTGAMYAFFTESFKKYLYDPNSPLHNDEYYIPVLQYIIASKRTEYAERERAKFYLDMAMKNRTGEKATDITYTLASGKTGTLYGIKAKYTILFFYNPDCHGCGETIAQLKIAPFINQGIKSGTVKLLAFFPDEDLSIWQKHLPDIPAEWINTYDKERIVEPQKLYDLKAIPTLYLLDADKKVLLKDTSVQALEQYLQMNR